MNFVGCFMGVVLSDWWFFGWVMQRSLYWVNVGGSGGDNDIFPAGFSVPTETELANDYHNSC